MPRPSDLIQWRVKTTLDGAVTNIDFSDSGAAEEHYNTMLASLVAPNDRVVLYRIKSLMSHSNEPYWKYQDVYKCDIMSPTGILHLRNRAPISWQDAERQIAHVKEQRKKR